MDIEPLSIEGAIKFTPKLFGDERGVFSELFKAPLVAEAIGHSFNLAQVNCSSSTPGVIRGIHFADVPPSQAKYVTCLTGAVLDVVVDIRVGSPTFGQWEAVRLDTAERRAVYLSEGLGHGFAAMPVARVRSHAACSSTCATCAFAWIHTPWPKLAVPAAASSATKAIATGRRQCIPP